MAESEFLSSGELGLFTVQNIFYLKRMQKNCKKRWEEGISGMLQPGMFKT